MWIIVLGIYLSMSSIPSALGFEQQKLVLQNIYTANSAYCAIRVNKAIALENRNSAYEGRGLGS